MKIAVIGSGYVGLVTGACLSDFGMEITCIDNDEAKIEQLNKGIIPIFEQGLKDLFERNRYYKRLKFSVDLERGVAENEVIFIAVGTPPNEDGSADLSNVLDVAKKIGKHINGYKVIVDKSTVPIGTGKKVKAAIEEQLINRGQRFDFDVVSNPEFLREGSAVNDFLRPDRVVIGVENEKAADILKEVYRVLYVNETPFVITNLETAEMIKYATNAFLATKITFINEIANLCEKVGADVKKVTKAMGMDGRVSPKFLHPGPGFGGSCFPKDTKALAYIGSQCNSRLRIIEATIEANERQKIKMVEKICSALKEVKEKTIGILGLTFKPNTDDVRESPAIVIVEELVRMGAYIKVSDPEGIDNFKKAMGLSINIEYCLDEYEVIEQAEALVIITEWNQYRSLDFSRIRELMVNPMIIDLRNIYDRKLVENSGISYIGVGV